MKTTKHKPTVGANRRRLSKKDAALKKRLEREYEEDNKRAAAWAKELAERPTRAFVFEVPKEIGVWLELHANFNDKTPGEIVADAIEAAYHQARGGAK